MPRECVPAHSLHGDHELASASSQLSQGCVRTHQDHSERPVQANKSADDREHHAASMRHANIYVRCSVRAGPMLCGENNRRCSTCYAGTTSVKLPVVVVSLLLLLLLQACCNECCYYCCYCCCFGSCCKPAATLALPKLQVGELVFTCATRSSSPLKSGVKHSTSICGLRCFSPATVWFVTRHSSVTCQ
jgi:hypothetical protein